MKYYFIGIKGSGMSTLACLLHDLGNTIIGYDDSVGYKFTLDGLNERNIPIYHGDEYPNLDEDTIVTYTAAINLDHHEVKRVSELGLKIISYPLLMGEISQKFETTCVCGTHGKTTTSLMISEMLDQELGCSYFVGDGSGHGNQDSHLLVMESCEFNKHLLNYHPYNVVLTNIDLDHTETYHNIDELIATFQEFINKSKNISILCGDDQNILKIKCSNAIYYGFNDNNDYIVKNRIVKDNKTHFDIYYHDKFFDHYAINLFGDHMVLDALASIVLASSYKISKQTIKDVLERFKPAKRRFNETAIGSNVIVDDYAHHPTEIKVTYDAAKQKYPDKEIIAIFLPNTYSRTYDLFSDFIDSLSLYDKAYLMDIDCNRENPLDYPNINSDELVKRIPNSEKISIDTIDKLYNYKNTVLCFMSCANISPMIEKYKNNYKE